MQIRVLENQAVQQKAVLAKEYVSRHQVNEMETLFGTAVEDLSNRLKDMEKRKTDVQRQVKNWYLDLERDLHLVTHRRFAM